MFALRARIPFLVAWLAGGAAAIAQTFPEIEPNGTKAEATAASCMTPGDSLGGASTGSSTTPGDGSLPTADTFRVKTCALPLGIYQHSLLLTSTPGGHSTALRGLNQTGTVGVGGTAGTADMSLQTSVTPNTRKWYGFGKNEEIYYRVNGTAATVSPYTVTLSTAAVSPVHIGFFAQGTITITTVGQGHSTETDLWVYDPGLNAIATFGNDDEFGGPTSQSTLTRTFSAGTYYLALTDRNLANDQTAAADDDFVFGALTDFPDVVVNSSIASALNCAFAVTDSSATAAVAATKAVAYDVLWFQFVVEPPAPGVTVGVPGIAGVMPCSCTNPNVGNVGCNNSAATGGAGLTDAGVASLAGDTVVFTSSGELPTALSIVLQGNLYVGAGAQFGDGVRIAGGSLKRLYTKPAVGGSVTAPAGADPTVSARSAALGDVIAAGSSRWYQVYYRDPPANFGCAFGPGGATFNISSGRRVLWYP